MRNFLPNDSYEILILLNLISFKLFLQSKSSSSFCRYCNSSSLSADFSLTAASIILTPVFFFYFLLILSSLKVRLEIADKPVITVSSESSDPCFNIPNLFFWNIGLYLYFFRSIFSVPTKTKFSYMVALVLISPPTCVYAYLNRLGVRTYFAKSYIRYDSTSSSFDVSTQSRKSALLLWEVMRRELGSVWMGRLSKLEKLWLVRSRFYWENCVAGLFYDIDLSGSIFDVSKSVVFRYVVNYLGELINISRNYDI